MCIRDSFIIIKKQLQSLLTRIMSNNIANNNSHLKGEQIDPSPHENYMTIYSIS